jgi:hypothetical protein
VNVIFGSAAGLTSTGNRLLVNPSISPLRGDEEQFGRAVAAGDFNDDGFGDLVIGDLGADSVAADGRSDLAVGVPGEATVFASQDNGGVNVLYGSDDGLSATGNQFWSQGSTGIPGAPEVFNRFGAALAAGDFDKDGRADLATGIPSDEVESFDELRSLDIRGSNATGELGGGVLIAPDATLTRRNSVVRGNRAARGGGVAVREFGLLTLPRPGRTVDRAAHAAALAHRQ